MKIAICYDLAPPHIGGAESYIINLGSRLASKHEVYWLTSRLPNTKRRETYQGMTIERVPILLPRHYLFPGRHSYSLTSFLPLIKLARKMDILQFNSYIAAISGWIVGKFSRRPYLLNVFEFFRDLWQVLSRNSFEKVLYPIIEIYIAKAPYPLILTISNYSKKILTDMGIEARLVKVVYPGVDHELFRPRYEPKLRERPDLHGRKVVGWCGRISSNYSKNLKCLLEAFRIVRKEIPSSVLVFDGTGFEQLAPAIKKLGLKVGEDVVYVGCSPRNQLPHFYSSCDVLALSSLSEGFGLVAVEAQACGVPVVCFRKGALPEVVRHKKTGLLVQDTSPEALAEGVVKILREKGLREKLGRNAVEWIKRFNWERSVEEHLEAYNSVIESFNS